MSNSFKHTFKIGQTVEIQPKRMYDSTNKNGDIGIIDKIDLKEQWVVKVNVFNNYQKKGNWEHVKFLKQL